MIRLLATMIVAGVLLNCAGQAITGPHLPPYGACK
jgi:hypothetical protein